MALPSKAPMTPVQRDLTTPSTVSSTPPPAAWGSKAGWSQGSTSQPPGMRRSQRASVQPETPRSTSGKMFPPVVKEAEKKVFSMHGASGKADSIRRRPASSRERKLAPANPPLPPEPSSSSSNKFPHAFRWKTMPPPPNSARQKSREAWGEGQNAIKRTESSNGRPRKMKTPKEWQCDRTSRSTRKAVWSACDVFWLFDKQWTGEISRYTYIDCLAEPPTVAKLRMLRQSNLENRFRTSAEPVTLREWLSLMWPSSTKDELDLMMRWAALRQAWSILHGKNFRGSDSDMIRIYGLLGADAKRFEGLKSFRPLINIGGSQGFEGFPDDSDDIPLAVFVLAEIVTAPACEKLFRGTDVVCREGRKTMTDLLKALYITPETERRMEEEATKMSSQYIAMAERTALAQSLGPLAVPVTKPQNV